jgi:hypothetical protein
MGENYKGNGTKHVQRANQIKELQEVATKVINKRVTI